MGDRAEGYLPVARRCFAEADRGAVPYRSPYPRPLPRTTYRACLDRLSSPRGSLALPRQWLVHGRDDGRRGCQKFLAVAPRHGRELIGRAGRLGHVDGSDLRRVRADLDEGFARGEALQGLGPVLPLLGQGGEDRVGALHLAGVGDDVLDRAASKVPKRGRRPLGVAPAELEGDRDGVLQGAPAVGGDLGPGLVRQGQEEAVLASTGRALAPRLPRSGRRTSTNSSQDQVVMACVPPLAESARDSAATS